MQPLRRPWLILTLCSIGAVMLWLPGLRYPVVSDTTNYALLGRALWTTGSYILHGVPHTKFLPVYPALSYPFVFLFGLTPGMKLASLLSGLAVLLLSYEILRRAFSKSIALVSVILIFLNHGFVVMTILGASDLLCTVFFLASLLCYMHAGSRPQWYLACGAFLGLSVLTRYNAVPLFAFYPLYTLLARPKHRFSPWFWGGMLLGGGLFSLWFLRKALLFGSPFANEYTTEFAERSIGVIPQAIQNITYYLDPFKNILPVLFLTSLYQLIRTRGRPWLMSGAMVAVLILFVFWPVRNLRYAFLGYTILTGFGVAGMVDLIQKSRQWKSFVIALFCAALLSTHLFALCMYSYGECNAWFDRRIGSLPKNMGLTMEGFYTWDIARRYLNGHAETGAIVRYETEEAEGIFREDLRPTTDLKECPAYAIKQQTASTDRILFQTEDSPVTYVVRESCK